MRKVYIEVRSNRTEVYDHYDRLISRWEGCEPWDSIIELIDGAMEQSDVRVRISLTER